MPTDYKTTLNLPRTDFPMKADLIAREPERLKQWESARLYEKIQLQRNTAPKFILHDGPPFANGDVHIGNALNKILKDIIVKYKTLRGFNAPYVPGWDCHGLPIEFKVSQEMRRGSAAAAAEAADASSAARTAAIRTACDAYARKFIDLQRAQFKRLGVFGDWERPYLTLNKEYEADELRLFADLVEKGFVYRGKKPVYWSIPCRTALAEAEVEYRDHVSQSIFVKLPVVGREKTFIVIWTTTPWTLPANLAVAYNRDFQYVATTVGDERYILFSGLLPAVAEKCGWANCTESSLAADELAALEYRHPFCNRTGRLFAAEFVTRETGTGFVHIAPGHGLDDYNLGRAAGLPVYSPVDDDGKFAMTNDLPVGQQMPAEMVGKAILEKHGRSDANDAVLHELRVRGALLHQENFHHSYPHCWRSKTPVIFRAMDQWFIQIDHVPASVRAPRAESGVAPEACAPQNFRAAALAEIDRVNWIPGWGVNRIRSAVQSRPDWCISRQRAWGVPIPAFYDASGNAILDGQIIRNAADLVEKHGSNLWFEKSAAELWPLVKPKPWSGAEAVSKSTDTLDVWIDSGSSSRSVLMRRPELNHESPGANHNPWQADMYLEGSDQHRGWFQSSLLLSLAGNGAAPFRTVLTHGFMVDADREKISKSKQGQGAYEKPQTAETYVRKWGADIVRLWVASQDFRNDIIVSEERIAKVAETYRVIRNALRYQLSNLYDFDPERHSVSNEKLTGLDRWILGEFSKLESDVIAAYDKYEFHVVYQKVSQFIAVELSAIYHDVIKDRLYTGRYGILHRRSTQTALCRLVTGLCQMLAPILAFTADEAWEFVPGKPTASVHEAKWKELKFELTDEERKLWPKLFKLRNSVLSSLEVARENKEIGKALEAKVELVGQSDEDHAVAKHLELFWELVNVSQLKIEAKFPIIDADSELQKMAGSGTTNVVLTGNINISHADGRKCERCWHWETDVGSNPEHPTLCGRCVQAVQARAADR